MKNVTLARRYAKALYEVALETKGLDDVLLGLSNIAHAFKTTPELERALLNPLVKREDKEKLIKTITSNKLILKLVDLLAKRKRLNLLSSIEEQVALLSDQSRGIHRALIKTPMPLDSAQKKAIEAALARSLGGTILGHYEVAQQLLGGVWIKLGDHVLDTTLKGRIDNLRHALVHSAN